MKVRAKLGLLLFAVVATFVAGLVALKYHERAEFRAISASRAEERRSSFDEFLKHWGETFEIFVNYFSAWDDMVAAIERGDRGWAETNLNDNALTSYRAHVVWAYRPDGTLAFTRNMLYSESVAEVPLPPGAMQTLLNAAGRCHFFVRVPPLGLMEISGATVQPSVGISPTTPPRGYFLAGRLWSNADLREMSLFTGNTISFASPDDPATALQDRADSTTISFTHTLPGWDGQALAALSVRNESPGIERLNRASQWLFFVMLSFALVLFLVLLLSLTRWVSSPLKRLSTCLRLQDSECLRPLKAKHDEFGDFARLMSDFFEQRDTLVREMAERRQTEEALQETQERLRHSQKLDAVGQLAGGIAHDFNNLLTAIIGYAELIAMRTQDATTHQEAGLIRKAGEQAADLTRQLLAFSRKQILQPRVIELNELVREMQKLLGRVIGEQIELRMQLDAKDARICADATQLKQVLLNLGVNARDAMPRGGVLSMCTADALVTPSLAGDVGPVPVARYVTLTVQDTGCGMDPETKARIFEPFFTTKGPGKGTGLGLATVYGIVRQSGGEIHVASTPGRGTTFTIHLPRADAPLDPPRPKPEHLAEGGHTETVLVVEDEEMVREFICAVLSEQGYDVLCAADGHEALRMALERSGPIDLLVSDVVMPQMTGPEIARNLLLTRPQMKVLFVSGYSNADISEDGILATDVHLLQKPFTPEVLSRSVRELLDETSEIPA